MGGYPAVVGATYFPSDPSKLLQIYSTDLVSIIKPFLMNRVIQRSGRDGRIVLACQEPT